MHFGNDACDHGAFPAYLSRRRPSPSEQALWSAVTDPFEGLSTQCTFDPSMTQPKNKGETQESPTNIRNGKELVEKTIDAIENNRCRTAMIQPQRQAFLLDCRQRSSQDLSRHLSVFNLGIGNTGRWLSRSMVDHGQPIYHQPHLPPQPQSTAWFSVGPTVARLYQDMLAEEAEASCPGTDGKIAHLLLFEGASGRAIQKYCIVYTMGEATAIAFHHLANGYSLVFAGIILRSSYDDSYGFRYRKSYTMCKRPSGKSRRTSWMNDRKLYFQSMPCTASSISLQVTLGTWMLR